jgi:DNA-binding transcriptional LysR family regulator
MELRQLEYFVAVAEEANFTRAAERVRISQSGVSAQLRQLERELGAELIDRSTRTATLTAAGEAALRHARATLASAGAVRQAVDEVTGLLRGRLVVGMVIGCTVAPLFDALARFHHAHPGIEISLLEDNSEHLIEGIRAGSIDFALIGVAATTPPGMNSLTVVSERLVALVPHDHPLAGRERVTLAQIAAHPIVCMPEGTGIRSAFDQSCAAQGLQPVIALQASAAEAMVDLAARGLGIAILSESMGPRFSDRMAVLPLLDAEVPGLLALVWTDQASPAVTELVRHSRAAFSAPAPAHAPADSTA